MYKHQLRVHGEYLAKAQALPKNAQILGNGGAQRCGSTMGASEIILAAASVSTLNAGKSLSLSIEDSTDGINFVTMPVFLQQTTSSVQTWKAGESMAVLPLPSTCRSYVRLNIKTDDTAATGAVDAFFNYLPR